MTAPTAERLDHLATVLANAVIDDREAGIYRANRRIFTDEELFELEMTHIFEGNWVYLAHESQVANPGDYFTTYIGRQPVVITRSKDGSLNCLINACAHRGAGVDEAVQLPVLAPRDDDRLAADGGGEVVPRVRDLALVRQVDPVALEDVL